MAIKISQSCDDTLSIGMEYAKTLSAGDLVVLSGEMGVGKTVFVKGIALGLGITERITSPTYAYMNDYGGRLYHYDCYRLSSGEQAVAMGLTEYFYAGGVSVVEWAENISSALPERVKTVKITRLSENTRSIEL